MLHGAYFRRRELKKRGILYTKTNNKRNKVIRFSPNNLLSKKLVINFILRLKKMFIALVL